MYDSQRFPDPSVSDMFDFVREKDPNESYDWANTIKCACAQYSHTKGMKSDEWLFGFNQCDMWRHLNRIAGGDGSQADRSFGALAKRLEKELA